MNTKVSFNAPKGYQDFDWSLNGVVVSKPPDYHYTIQSLGVHEVECKAFGPTHGAATGYMRTRCRVTVE